MIKVFRQGDNGPAVWLLHGYGSGPLAWHHWLPELSRHFRVHVPNLTPLFSASAPISYSRQVLAVQDLILAHNPDREPIFLVGSSFGGTLSFGVRSLISKMVAGQVLINPMPLSPVEHVRIPQLRVLFGMNMVPGALSLYLKTEPGRRILLELGEVFGFGHDGRRSLGGLSRRKLELISRAVQRFVWICQNEDWSMWQLSSPTLSARTWLLMGQDDPLFSRADFLSYQLLIPNLQAREIQGAGHTLERSHAEELVTWLARELSASEAQAALHVS